METAAGMRDTLQGGGFPRKRRGGMASPADTKRRHHLPLAGVLTIIVSQMNTGKLVRLNRIFGHASGRLCSVAVDHFMTYQDGLPAGLRDMSSTLKAVVKGRPDAVTMQIGMARNAWGEFAGLIPFILQASMLRIDDSAMAQAARPEDAVRLGADAFAIVCLVRGPTEARYMQAVSEAVREAERFEMPVICHIYPRSYDGGAARFSYTPEDIAWAARCAAELGVDVIKVPYCGNVEAYAQIVSASPVRIVAAGGPKTEDLRGALAMMADVVKSGAAGATIGRNIWGFDNITANVKAFKAVIHDGMSPEDALKKVGL
jgi:fructose-bisphosphate aldolase, class I